MRRLLLLLSTLLLAVASQAAPAPQRSTPRLPLRHIGIVQGLAQSAAQAITQDDRGFMWLGTQSGLQRFDGYQFINYHHDPADPSSLAQNDVVALAAAPNGTLWVATRTAGVDVLRPGRHGFEHHTHQPGRADSLSSDVVYSILVDHVGQVWVGTQAGLDRLQQDGTFRHFDVPRKSSRGAGVLSLFEDRHGRIWVGTGHGVYVLDAGSDRLQPLTVSNHVLAGDADSVLGGAISAFAEMPDATMWIGGSNGMAVCSADGRVLRVFRHLGNNPIPQGSDHVRAIVRGRTGTIWVATYGGGLGRMRQGESTFTRFRHDPTDASSLSSNNLSALYVDQTGLLWIGSVGGGIDIYNPTSRAFESLRHAPGTGASPADDLVWAVASDPARRIWAGTHAGLSLLDARNAQLHLPTPDARAAALAGGGPVMVLAGDPSGGLWVANTTHLFRRADNSSSYVPIKLDLPESSPDSASIRQIFFDASRQLWLGTAAGLLRLDRNTGAVQRRYVAKPDRDDSLPRSSISSICQTRDKAMWIGTGHGLRRFDAVTERFSLPVVRRGGPNVLGVSDILSCLADPDGSLWLGTASGIIHFQPGQGIVRSYGEADGLPSLTIYSLLRDAEGSIWAGTDRGLMRLDPTSGRVRSYGQRDGLENEEFNQNAAYAGADGTLYFGGVNGVTAVHPERLFRSTSQPRVAISGYTVIDRNGEQFSTLVPDAGLTLNHRQNIITLNVAVMDYTDPEDNFFRYRLLGFDESWHILQGRHSITFTNLDPGHYTLEVAGAGSNDIVSPHQASLAIHVLSPPWRSWWAWAAYAVAAILVSGAGLSLFAVWIRRQRDLVSEQQRRRWAEAQQELMQEVTRLEDEGEIARHLLERLPQLVPHDCAVFFAERGDALHVLAERGFPPERLQALQVWPREHVDHIERLRNEGPSDPLVALDVHAFRSVAPHIPHVIELPFSTDEGDLRLLVVGRAQRPFNAAEHDTLDVLMRQINVVLDRAQLLGRLAVLASVDGLTQALNRRSFLERAEADFKRARRYHESLALLLLDLDHFKSINDSHGHQVGDEVLRELVAACRTRLRDSDCIGRYGGEEFVVCLPHADVDIAHGIAERLRADVQDLRIVGSEQLVRVTVSIGVAVITAADTGLDSMIARADTALYAAKRGGRNRVIVNPGESPDPATTSPPGDGGPV